MKFRIFVFLALYLLVHATLAYSQQQYRLSHVANGRFASGSFRTTFVLFNNNSTSVTASIVLTGDEGSPLTVTIAGLGTASEFAISLEPGASQILQTDGSGNLVSGAAEVNATAEIGVSAIFSVFDINGNFVTESGVGTSEPLTDFVIPVDVTGSFNTGVALFNFGVEGAAITIRLLDTNGQEVDRITINLSGGLHLARFVAGPGQLFPAVSNFRGTLAVSSSVPVAAVALRQIESPLSYTSLPAVSRAGTKTEFNLAHVANGAFDQGSFRTSFIVFNISSSTANIEISLSKDDGSAFPVTIPGRGTASSFGISLAPGASVFLQTDGSGSLAAGAARITSNAPIGASSIFSVFDSQGRFQTEAGVGDSPAQTELTIPVDVTGDFDTAFAFYNPGSSGITLTIRLLDENGLIVATTSLSLDAKNHVARFVTQLFAGTSSFRGSLSVTSSGGVAALTLRQNSAPLSYTTLPVARGAAQGRPQAQPLLSKLRTGVEVVSDTTINETLLAGFRLAGTVSGPGVSSMVVAESGSLAYASLVDIATGRYRIILPAGTYNLTVCYAPTGVPEATLDATFSDPDPVQVSADTTRDVTLPSLNIFGISGTVGKLTASITSASIIFTSTDNRFQGSFDIGLDGTYSGQLPSGSYGASLRETLSLTETEQQSLYIYNMGSTTVSGSAVTASFNAPATARLSGRVRGPGGSPVPENTLVTAADSSAPPLSALSCVLTPATSLTIASDAGSYQLILPANRTYNPSVAIPLGPAPSFFGTLLFPVTPSPLTLSGDMTRDLDSPQIPSQVTLSGRVTDSSGRGISGVGIAAFTQNLTGAANAGFASVGGTTDANGDYRVTLLSGSNYQISFIPPEPEP